MKYWIKFLTYLAITTAFFYVIVAYIFWDVWWLYNSSELLPPGRIVAVFVWFFVALVPSFRMAAFEEEQDSEKDDDRSLGKPTRR